jgi:hypothetical protein
MHYVSTDEFCKVKTVYNISIIFSKFGFCFILVIVYYINIKQTDVKSHVNTRYVGVCFRSWENAGVILLRTAHLFVCSRNSSSVYHKGYWLIDSPCSTAPCPQHHHHTLLLIAILLTLQGLILPLLLLLHQRHAFSVLRTAVDIPGLRFVVPFRPQDASEGIQFFTLFCKSLLSQHESVCWQYWDVQC